MTHGLTFGLTFLAAILSGLVAGVFFAFSNFIMPAFGRISEEHGIAAMSSINVAVMTPAFMFALFGTALICLALASGAMLNWGQPGQNLVLAACLIYVIGCAGVTMVCNVPLNNELAALQSGTPQATEIWARYLSDWTYWNSVRTAASLVSGILFVLALV
jgi:uncharacterized membrane protein